MLKHIEERLASLPEATIGPRGPRGGPGPPGENGRDFVFSEHEETIRSWAKEYALKFSDLTEEQLSQLRGRDGSDGRDGRDFVFEECRASIEQSIRECVDELEPRLKLKFSDLTEDEISDLRGPRGRDGRDGKDFVFEDHEEYFKSLKLKFSDLTEDERASLVLRFNQLTDSERDSLKLRFDDLSDEEKISLRGPRGVRGQKGAPGRAGYSSTWISGSGDPVVAGSPGDMYLDVTTGTVYRWED